MTSTLSVESAGNTMNIFEAKPEGPALGAVIVVQEAFGVNEHIQDICRRFAAEGYLTVAPHLFHRTGDPTIAYDAGRDVMPHLSKLNVDDLTADIDATVGYLADAGFEPAKTCVVGFCMGGSITFMAATGRPFAAAASFYGGGIAQGRFGMAPLLEQAAQLKTPWIGLFGDRDNGIPTDEVESLRKEVDAVAVLTDIVRYSEADHGFHCDARDSYHEVSAKDAWQRTLQWFDTHLRAR